MKKIIILLISLLLLSGCSMDDSQNATEPPETLPPGAVKIGISSYSCITGTSEKTVELSEDETAKVSSFAHMIYNPDNQYICTLSNTIVSVSPDDAAISEVEASLSDMQIDGLTVSEHLSDNTATVIVYLNQMSVCHFQYRLSSDGTIEFIS